MRSPNADAPHRTVEGEMEMGTARIVWKMIRVQCIQNERFGKISKEKGAQKEHSRNLPIPFITH